MLPNTTLTNAALRLGSGREGCRLRTRRVRATGGRHPTSVPAVGGPRFAALRARWVLRVVHVTLVTVGFASASRGQVADRPTSTERLSDPAGPGPGWFGFRLRQDGSLVLDDVYPGSPAESAGLRAGDTLVRVAGRPADRPTFQAVLARVAPGDTIRVGVRRGPTTYTVHLRAGPRPNVVTATGPTPGVVTYRLDALRSLVLGQLTAARAHVTVVAPAGSVVEATDSGVVFRNSQRGLHLRLDTLVARGRQLRLGEVTSDSTAGAHVRLARVSGRALHGMVVAPLPPGVLARSSPDGGVLVTAVRPQSAAARAGLQPLDIVVRAAGTPVTTTEALDRLLRTAAHAGDGAVTLGIRRGAALLDVRLAPDSRDER